MDANHGAGGFTHGRAKNFARVGEGAVGGPRGNFFAADEPVAAVEAKDPEFFHFESSDDGLHVGGDEIGAGEQRGFAGLLAQHPAGNFDDGDELQGFDRADAFEFAEVGGGPADETGERARVRDEALGEGEDILAAGAAAQEHREEFGVAESGGSEFLEPFLRTFPERRRLQAILRGGGRGRIAHRVTQVSG